MNPIFDNVVEFSATLSQFAFNLFLQSSVLILFGLLAARFLKHQGSATQSAIFRATLIAVVVCPLASITLNQLGLGGWTLNLPPPTRVVVLAKTPTSSTPEIQPSASPVRPSSAVELESPTNKNLTPQSQSASPTLPLHSPVAKAKNFDHAEQASSAPRSSVIPPSQKRPPAVSNASAERIINNPFWIIVYVGFGLLWMLGSLLMLLRLFFAYQKLAAIRRESPRASNYDHSVCKRLSDHFQTSAPSVRRNSLIASPCLIGIFTPTILLPSELQNSVSLQKALAHEIAHLKRRDSIWNLIQRFVLSLVFFQPLMWRLIYRLETSAEEVCDDIVVGHCSDRKGYAEQLVALAESTLIAPNIAGLGMFKRSSSMLHHRVARILDRTRKLTTQTSLPMAIGIILFAFLGSTLGGFLGNGPPIANKKSTNKMADVRRALSVNSENEVVLSGYVTDRNGTPIPDATVYDKHSQTSSDSKGFFKLETAAANSVKTTHRTLIAAKNGFGLGYSKFALSQSKNIEISLPSDTKIQGQLVDFEGMPIVGATVALKSISALDDADEFLSLAKAITTDLSQLPRGTSLPAAKIASVISNEQGRFELEGIGTDRLVQLRIDGAEIARTNARILTRQIEPVSVLRESGMFSQRIGEVTFHGQNPTIVCQPTQPIEGIVVDRETGAPLAGVEIYSDVFSGLPISGVRDIKATSDIDGRFQLSGMPVGPDNSITAFPKVKGKNAIPYLARDFEVPEGDGVSLVEMRLELQRGTWIRGKVLNARTGQAVENCRVTYKPFLDNELAADLYSENSVPDPIGYLETQEDGKFELVALPGRAVLDVWVVDEPYFPPGQGWDQISQEHKDHLGNIQVIGYPSNREHPTMMKEINVVGDQPMEGLVYELDPGKDIQINLFDPAGKPLEGVTIRYGLSGLHDRQVCERTQTLATGFLKGQSRTLNFHHVSRDLGLIRTIRFEDQSPLNLTLQPNAKFHGVLVDRNGDPIVRAKLRVDVSENKNFHLNSLPFAINTDEQGRFHGTAYPGSYNFNVETSDNFLLLARNISFQPAEDFDFGTVDLEANHKKILDEANSRNSSENVSEDRSNNNPGPIDIAPKQDLERASSIEFTGRVVDLYGTPVPNVEILRPTSKFPNRRLATTTDSDGHFVLRLPKSEVTTFADNRPLVFLKKAGYGQSTYCIDSTQKKQELTLANDDHPIQGKLIDPEGNPISGAQIKIEYITIFEANILAGTLQQAENDENILPLLPSGMRLPADHIPTVNSDLEGRFTIRGIGAGRLAQVVITGETTAIRKAIIATCDCGKVKYEDPKANTLSDGHIHGFEPTLVCEPSQPLEGIVVDRDTKQPLAGFAVSSYGFLNNGVEHYVGQDDLKTTTDRNGRFRLTGLPKGLGNSVIVTAPTRGEFAQPYITQTAEVSNGQGIDPVSLEVGMQRGVWIEGRVSDRETGDPIVDAGVQYMPLDSNSAAQGLDRMRQQLVFDYYGVRTDDNGEYRFVGLPGDAALGVWIFGDPSYPREPWIDSIPEEHKKKNRLFSSFFSRINPLTNTVQLVEPTESGLKKDFQVSKGETVTLKLIDSRDEPVQGAKITFIPALVSNIVEAPSDVIELQGFVADQSRTLLIQHPEKKLGAIVSVHANSAEVSGIKLARVVIMEPYGKLKLQLHGQDGNPMVSGNLNVSRLSERGTRVNGYHPRCQIDKEGRVECDLIPGKYSISVQAFQRNARARTIVIQPGKTLDLGDIDASNIGPPPETMSAPGN